MKTKTYTPLKWLGSSWAFTFILLLFVTETGWLALTSRFPMAFDETYHFGLIRFFSHRLNPIVTHQAASTYKFGAIVQDPSFLYHYLMSFPYRLITLFTHSLEAQVIGLRLINVALAVASLLVMRKLLKLVDLSDGLANVAVLAFAMTPLVTALSAQINYDNLLILSASLCIYETVLFAKELDQKVVNAGRLLALLSLCLFASLVKFSFLPVFLGIVGLIVWKFIAYGRRNDANLLAEAQKSFTSINRYPKLLLLTATILSSLLFVRFYGVNLVKYHNPVPQCNQVLNVPACKHYYSWNNDYTIAQHYHDAHPKAVQANTLQYSAYWSLLSSFQLFGAIMPLQGLYYVSQSYLSIIALLGVTGLICTIINFKTMLQKNKNLLAITAISLIYVLFLWARNYHDYLHLGQPVAVNGRYLAPVLIYFYALLGSGLHHTLKGRQTTALIVKLALALAVVVSFAYYGGFSQYLSQIRPVYGRINPSNNYGI